MIGPSRKRQQQQQHDTCIQMLTKMSVEQFDKHGAAAVLRMLEQGRSEMQQQLSELVEEAAKQHTPSNEEMALSSTALARSSRMDRA